jgi:acyl dehydratase
MASAQITHFGDIDEGAIFEREYVITSVVYEHFLSAFKDRNPLHIDEHYARSAGFSGVVMHGAILNGFVSHFVGMVFPGANSLLLSMELRYSHPSYLGDSLRLEALVAQKLEAKSVVVLHLRILNQTRGVTAATGTANVKVRIL